MDPQHVDARRPVIVAARQVRRHVDADHRVGRDAEVVVHQRAADPADRQRDQRADAQHVGHAAPIEAADRGHDQRNHRDPAAVGASSDAWVLDRAGAWIDLPAAVSGALAASPWLVDLATVGAIAAPG